MFKTDWNLPVDDFTLVVSLSVLDYKTPFLYLSRLTLVGHSIVNFYSIWYDALIPTNKMVTIFERPITDSLIKHFSQK